MLGIQHMQGAPSGNPIRQVVAHAALSRLACEAPNVFTRCALALAVSNSPGTHCRPAGRVQDVASG